jgi:hypothetical protein
MSFIECHFGEDYVIVQRGHGGLVLVIIYLCLFIMEWGTKIFFHDSNYYQQHKWPRLIAFLGAAALVWILSPRKSPDTAIQQQEWLISSSSYPDRSSINPESPAASFQLFREQDSFFGIPIRFWPLVLCGLGVICYFALGPAPQ